MPLTNASLNTIVEGAFARALAAETDRAEVLLIQDLNQRIFSPHMGGPTRIKYDATLFPRIARFERAWADLTHLPWRLRRRWTDFIDRANAAWDVLWHGLPREDW